MDEKIKKQIGMERPRFEGQIRDDSFLLLSEGQDRAQVEGLGILIYLRHPFDHEKGALIGWQPEPNSNAGKALGLIKRSGDLLGLISTQQIADDRLDDARYTSWADRNAGQSEALRCALSVFRKEVQATCFVPVDWGKGGGAQRKPFGVGVDIRGIGEKELAQLDITRLMQCLEEKESGACRKLILENVHKKFWEQDSVRLWQEDMKLRQP